MGDLSVSSYYVRSRGRSAPLKSLIAVRLHDLAAVAKIPFPLSEYDPLLEGSDSPIASGIKGRCNTNAMTIMREEGRGRFNS